MPSWPQIGPGRFFPTNLDLAHILGDTDFDFENFNFIDFFGSQISRCPVPRFQNFQKSGRGPAWAQLGPGLGPLGPGLGPTLGPAWARLGRGWDRAAGPLGGPGGPSGGPGKFSGGPGKSSGGPSGGIHRKMRVLRTKTRPAQNVVEVIMSREAMWDVLLAILAAVLSLGENVSRAHKLHCC